MVEVCEFGPLSIWFFFFRKKLLYLWVVCNGTGIVPVNSCEISVYLVSASGYKTHTINWTHLNGQDFSQNIPMIFNQAVSLLLGSHEQQQRYRCNSSNFAFFVMLC